MEFIHFGYDAEFDIIVGESSDEEEDEEEIQSIQRHFGGYDYEFVDDVLPSQTCSVCLLPMRDAVQTTECGHRFCRKCLQTILSSDNPLCPTDRTEIAAEGGFFADRAWARDISCLHVKCEQNKRGCKWIGEVKHAEKHREECPYEEEQCIACGDDIQRRLQETHMDIECPKRIVECEFCEDEFRFIEKQDHEEKYCRRFPLTCTNNCGREEIPREELASHISNDCPMTEVICPYAKAGCPFQDKRAYLNEHIEATVEDHLQMTWSSLEEAKEEVKEVKLELDSMKDLRHKNEKLTESVDECRKQIGSLSQAMKKLQEQNVLLKKSIEKKERAVPREKRLPSSRWYQQTPERLYSQLNIPPESKEF